MRHPAALFCVCFCAGLLGALAGLCAVWAWGMLGLPDLPFAGGRPLLAPAGFHSRLVWGGLWGGLYFLTVGSLRTRRRWVRKGVVVSLIPTLYYLIVDMPGRFDRPDADLVAVSLIVIVINLLWGVFTGLFARLLWGRS